VTSARKSTKQPNDTSETLLSDGSTSATNRFAGRLRLGSIDELLAHELAADKVATNERVSHQQGSKAATAHSQPTASQASHLGASHLGASHPEASQLGTGHPETGHPQIESAADSASSIRALENSNSLALSPPSENAMEDYYQLQDRLLLLTVVFTALVFPFAWLFYSLQIALNYLLGACAGVVYLRMLARNVSTLGRDQKKNSSGGRLAVFVGVMIVALRWEQLAVIPVFLGFLTYKVAIIVFVLWTSTRPEALSSD
jgi:ATP synthase protein I